MTRLAVLGSPIAHSVSPTLHLAAYRQLGLDWSYERIELSEPELAEFLAGDGRHYRGFSVTMPLKQELLRLSAEADEVARLTGAANTVTGMDSGRLQVTNTDVAGIVRACAAHGLTSVRHATLLGGGATAASALVALAELGVESVDLRLRTPARAEPLVRLATEVGVTLLVDQIDPSAAERQAEHSDLVLSTLPGGALDPFAVHYAPLAPVIFDVAYSPWPSKLASHAREATVIPGLEMLIQQALVQVRVFVHGDPFTELPDEAAVFAAMRHAAPVL